MIIVAIIALSGLVLAAVLGALGGLPEIDLSGVVQIVGYVAPYLSAGVGFVKSITYWEIVFPLFVITLAIHGVIVGYKVVMWVARKIPMLGVSD